MATVWSLPTRCHISWLSLDWEFRVTFSYRVEVVRLGHVEVVLHQSEHIVHVGLVTEGHEGCCRGRSLAHNSVQISLLLLLRQMVNLLGL